MARLRITWVARWFWLLGVGLASFVASSSAQASEGEVVTHLALFELSGNGVHDNLARRLGEAVRREVGKTDGHQLSDARVSLEQLSLVQDCEPEELSCLGKIAKQLGVSGFIFGQLQNEGSGAFAQLSLFDTASQSIKRTARAMIALRDASGPEIDRKAQSLVSQLLIAPQPKAAEPASPNLLPEVGAPPSAAEPIEPAESGVSGKRVAGYALLGGAALSVGLSVFAFVEIDRAQSSPNLDRYRRAVGREDPSLEDVCDAADEDRDYGLDARSFREVKDGCGTGRTFEMLQFIFLGAAAVSGGLSAYLLLSDDAPRERKPLGLLDAFPVTPVVRRNAAELRAKLRF